ncbi:primosomal protein N' [Lapidilactobacillus luobeiensis]|uniref:primosomal protein N' n=1 Tax=Lapidilactobacillus luobeiensis TaxID=2950371 RepID=UPI0021C4187E|nr:primosomal protein N' [Lapidilactobacillus luobeiensis]
MIAQIIIDIPAQQTNRAFDYAVPPELTTIIAPGMRVLVPFGRSRKKQRQGFVWRLAEKSSFKGRLKPISEVLDLTPVLNEEMLALAEWLAQDTFSFLISCLQTMLPNALRASYQRRFQLQKPLAAGSLLTPLLDSQTTGKIPEQISAPLLRALKTAEQTGQIKIDQQVAQKGQIKEVALYSSNLTMAQATEMAQTTRANAHQQLALLTFLQQHPQFSGTSEQWREALPELKQTTLTTAVKKAWLQRRQIEQYRQPNPLPTPKAALPLTGEQAAAYHAVAQAMTVAQREVFLLEGITGSGKTEVYLAAMADALRQGKTALMLVPEIALTPQMVQRVQERFQKDVAVLHSGLSVGERFDEWRRIERGEARVVVGARSAAFAPLKNIGVMIIDEEHESSYKQDDMPRYHARDVVLHRATTHHCPVILGSATPSLESRARAQKNVYHLLRLTQRPKSAQLPEVKVLDMRSVGKVDGKPSFSQELIDALAQRLKQHEQSILLLNRRGYANFVLCRDCGNVIKCPNCDISLTLHRDIQALKCHYCGHQEAIPQVCPVCHSSQIRDFGAGTQRIEAELAAILPQARILRMDVDTTARKGGHQRLIKKFGRQEADILLGTQMIAKGLDFPNVTLVGVINADTSLSLPDFRASEKTFQLLTQVSGRAGRAEKQGQVLIQTYNPDNYAIQLASHQDYEAFYQREMHLRHVGGYPPYYYTILVSVNHRQEDLAAQKIYQLYRQVSPVLSKSAVLLGPTPRMIARINNQYYYQFIIKYKHEEKLFTTLQRLVLEMQQESGFQLRIDREPLQIS